jgi:hypothetical protein
VPICRGIIAELSGPCGIAVLAVMFRGIFIARGHGLMSACAIVNVKAAVF